MLPVAAPKKNEAYAYGSVDSARRPAGCCRVASIEAAIFLIWLALLVVDRILSMLRFLWRLLTCCCRGQAADAKELVIVGASFGGLAVQQRLAGRRELKVTLVDFKDYFEYTPGILRCFVAPEYLKQLTCPLPSRHNRLAVGEVDGVSESEVFVKRADGSRFQLSYDYLVLACGSSYAEPVKPTAAEANMRQREHSWLEAHQRLRLSENVIIVGGGAVGVELAGEILTEFPQKRLTLLTSSLLPGLQPACIEYASSWLRQAGAELRLGERIAEVKAESVTLESGEVLEAGVVYKCTGVAPNSGMLQASPFEGLLGQRGAVQVTDQLQLEGHENVFCVGDMMSHSSGELKLGHTAEVNGLLAAENVLLKLKKKELGRYPSSVTGAAVTPKLIALSLGRYYATMSFNWLTLSGWLPAVVKWLLEWTKVAAAEERPVGLLFWQVADAAVFFLGRTLIRPA